MKPYTAKKCDMDRHHLIAHALLHGYVDHPAAEQFDPKCTVIRSRIPEIGMKLGWPIKNVNSPRVMARYVIDTKDLSDRAGCPVEAVGRAAKDWLAEGKLFSGVGPFLEFLKGYRAKNPASDPLARMIFKAAKKVRRGEAQGELWAY